VSAAIGNGGTADPDFCGVPGGPDTIIAAAPDVFNHNVETIPRLYPEVRPGADYRRSLDLLRACSRSFLADDQSGLMVWVGRN